MPKPRIVRAFSAGGVVFRVIADASSTVTSPELAPTAADSAPLCVAADPPTAAPLPAGVEVVLVGFLRDDTWTLPKGTPAAGESVEQTALREVREETGIEATIIGDLGSIQYTFARRGVRFNKEVRHFLMRAVGGDVSLHDAEYDEARWFPFEDAVLRLTYVNEAQVVRRARPLVAEHLARSGS